MSTWPGGDVVALLQAIVALGCIPLAIAERRDILRCCGWSLMAVGYAIAAASRFTLSTATATERSDMYFLRIVCMMIIAAGVLAMTWGYFWRAPLRYTK